MHLSHKQGLLIESNRRAMNCEYREALDLDRSEGPDPPYMEDSTGKSGPRRLSGAHRQYRS